MSIDLDALEKLNAGRTPGEWYHESDDEGDGRYQASFLHASDLRRDYDILADSINSTASVIEDESDCDGVHRWDGVARANFEFIAAAANNMAELIRLARIGQREERHRQNLVDCAVKGLMNETAADLLRLHEHFSDTMPEAPRALIDRMVGCGFVDRVAPSRWEFNELGEGVIAALKARLQKDKG